MKVEVMRNPFAEARKRFGCGHPAQQLIILLDRLEKLEAVVSDMINNARPFEKTIKTIDVVKLVKPVKLDKPKKKKKKVA